MYAGKSIVNSISMKEGEAEFLRQANIIRKYGAAVIVMAFDEDGQADTYQRRIDICEEPINSSLKKLIFLLRISSSIQTFSQSLPAWMNIDATLSIFLKQQHGLRRIFRMPK
jgi:hypothetical protein